MQKKNESYQVPRRAEEYDRFWSTVVSRLPARWLQDVADVAMGMEMERQLTDDYVRGSVVSGCHKRACLFVEAEGGHSHSSEDYPAMER